MNNNICTILLISYNHEKYIRKAIESVLEQETKYPFIIRIFDDCSTDGTIDIIREYAEKYPNLVEAHINKTNLGAQQNIWNAYKSVDTKYCALLECDDYWCCKDKLELQIQALEKHSECSFSSHNTMYINTDCEERETENFKTFILNSDLKKINVLKLDDLKNNIKYDYITHVSSRLIRTKCLDIDNALNIEDVLYDNCQFYYLLMKGSMHYNDSIMTVYNMNSASSFSGKKINNKIRTHLENIMNFNRNTNYQIEGILYRHLLQFIGYWLYINDKKENNKKKISVKEIKRYFIPRFILDLFDLPRDLSRFIRKFIKGVLKK